MAERFLQLLQHAGDASLLADERSRILVANDRALEVYGYSRSELRGMTLESLEAADTGPEPSTAVTHDTTFETVHRRKEGTSFPVEVSRRAVELAGVKYELATIRDLTTNKVHESEIKRLNRLYATLSHVGQAIARCRSREKFFAEICRVMVDIGRFRAAWITWKGANGNGLTTMAQRQSDAEPQLAMPGWSGGCGVMAEAVRSGGACLCTNSHTDPRCFCCRQILARVQEPACAAFAFRMRGAVSGAFSICSIEPSFFNTEEMRLLEEVAEAISIALDHLDQEAQRREAEQALRVSELKFRRLHQSMTDAYVATDMAGRIQEFNQAYQDMLGYPEVELRQLTYQDLTPERWREFENRIVVEQIQATGSSVVYEKEYRRKDGVIFPVELRTFLILDDAGKPARMWAIVRDITARKREERQLQKANRALRLLSLLHQELLRATDEQTLLQATCRLAVESGGYRMAWVGFAQQDEAGSVRPMAWSGFTNSYLERVRVSWKDTEYGRGPTGTAIRTGQAVLARDLSTDPAFGPWRAAALDHGYASSIALPLRHAGSCFGALNLYSAEPDAFDAGEVKLLGGLADDLAYGLGALRQRAERERAEEALRRSEEWHRTILLTAMDGFWRADMQGRILEVNEAYARMSGYGTQELLAMRVSDLDAVESPADTARHIQKVIATGQDRFETRHRRKDGSIYAVEVSVQFKPGDGGQTVGFLRDITERQQAEQRLYKSEEQFRSFMRNFPGLTFIKDAEGRVLFASEGFTAYLGLEISSMLGKTNQDLFPPEFAEKITRDDQRVLATGKAEEIEEQFGGEVWLTRKFPIIQPGAPPLLGGISVRRQPK